jgi:hypothetical protein
VSREVAVDVYVGPVALSAKLESPLPVTLCSQRRETDSMIVVLSDDRVEVVQRIDQFDDEENFRSLVRTRIESPGARFAALAMRVLAFLPTLKARSHTRPQNRGREPRTRAIPRRRRTRSSSRGDPPDGGEDDPDDVEDCARRGWSL